MAWLEKATLDLTNAKFESNVSGIVKDFVMENTWNTPFIIKTGDDVGVRSKVTMVLDTLQIKMSKWRDDEIEVVDV